MTSLHIDSSKTALLVMDLQEMMRLCATAPHSPQQVFDRAAELLAAFRSRGAFVVLVKIGWSADGKDRLQPICDESFTRAASMTPEALALVPELNVQLSDYQVTETAVGRFLRDGLGPAATPPGNNDAGSFGDRHRLRRGEHGARRL